MLTARTCHAPYKTRKWDCTPIKYPYSENFKNKFPIILEK